MWFIFAYILHQDLNSHAIFTDRSVTKYFSRHRCHKILEVILEQ